MSKLSSLEVLRPVGLLEKHATARHFLELYNNVAVSASYSTAKSTLPIPSLVYRALAIVIATHPSLRAIPVDEDKPSLYFVRLPRITLSDVVTLITRQRPTSDDTADPELDEVLQNQHNINFKDRFGEIPFWRLVVLQESGSNSHFTASFVYHHALADGTSGLAFHRTFLSAIQTISADMTATLHVPDTEPDTTVDSPRGPLLPTLEELHPLPLSLWYLLHAQWRDWFPNMPHSVWTASPITASRAMRASHFRSLCFPAISTSHLVAASRANSTTLTGTVEAALAAALFVNLPTEHFSSLRCDGAISLRRFLPPDTINADSIGTWVSRYEEEHNRGSTSSNAMDHFSWAEARRVRGTIEQELGKKGRNSIVGTLRWVGDFHKFFQGRMGRRRGESFELTNIGVFRPAGLQHGTSEDWEVGRVVFSQSADVVGAAMNVSLVTGGDKCLNIGFSWLEGIVDGAWMGQVIKSLEVLLEEVAHDSCTNNGSENEQALPCTCR